MKKVNILIVILAIALVSVACESYDDYNTDRKPVVGFTLATRNINNIPEGGSKTDSLEVFISDLSSSARTYTVITLPADTLPAAPENYSFEFTVTFPPNTRSVFFKVTGVDNSLTTERNFFKIAIQPQADIVSGGRSVIGVKN